MRYVINYKDGFVQYLDNVTSVTVSENLFVIFRQGKTRIHIAQELLMSFYPDNVHFETKINNQNAKILHLVKGRK